MESDLLSLKANPIFQLSLASKELFHTNFLYWLATTEDLRHVFCKIVNNMLGDNPLFTEENDKWKIGNDVFNDSNFVVLREYNNFDLCICKVKSTNNSTEDDKTTQECNLDSNDSNEIDKDRAGEIILVLENKFKSVCSREQLDRYNEKILEYNLKYYKHRVCSKLNISSCQKNKKDDIIEKLSKENMPKLILLSLTKEFVEKESIKKLNEKEVQITSKITYTFSGLKWHLANYEELANSLKNNTIQDNFTSQLINHYASFIEFFSKGLNDKLNELKSDSKWGDIYEPCEFDTIRCRDIWQKNIMHKYAQELAKKILEKNKSYEIDFDSSDSHTFDKEEWNNNQKIYIGIYFSHGNAALEIKCRIFKNMMYCIQQQGKLCEGIVVFQDEKNSPDEIKKSKKKEDKDEWKGNVVSFLKNKGIDVDANPDIHSYQSNNGFYYQIKNIDKVNDTLEYMVNKVISYINKNSNVPQQTK